MNDDDQFTLSIDDVNQAEVSTGTTAFRFTVTLSSASSQPVSVQVQTANGTATAGSDYTAAGPQTLTFAPGTTTQTFTLPVVGDATPESDETFTVRLSGAVNASIGDSDGVGTIKNDDADGAGTSQSEGERDGSGVTKDKEDSEGKPTEEQRQQQQLTNTSNKDDVYVEGSVVEVYANERQQYVLIANRDGIVKVVLFRDAAKVAGSIRVGDYLEASGEKQHEQLFHADDVSIKRGR